MQPVRIQRKKVKGWKMPPNTVSVTRPGRFGNPFKLVGDMIYVDASHRRKILDPWVLFRDNGGYNVNDVVNLFRDLMLDLNSHEVEPEIYNKFRLMRDTIKDLQGKNLACFCKEGEPCHGDILLKLANL